MQVFVAEACSGLDAESVRPLRDALRCFGAVLVKKPQSAEAFVLAWTETAAVASHVQALALDAWKLRECTGRPQLFWWPISSEPVPAGYQFYAEAAIPLPADAAAAARLICRSDEAAAPAEQPS